MADDQWYKEIKPINPFEEDVMFSKFLEAQKLAIYKSLGIPKEMIGGGVMPFETSDEQWNKETKPNSWDDLKKLWTQPDKKVMDAAIKKLTRYRPIGVAALAAFQIFMRQTSPMYCLLMGDK